MGESSVVALRPGRSEFGPTWANWVDLLGYFLDRAVAETTFELVDFTEAFVQRYFEVLPEAGRTLNFEDLAPYTEWSPRMKAVARMTKIIERYRRGDLHLPAVAVPIWVEALPQPYQDQCRIALARSMGLMGVHAVTPASCRDEADIKRVADLAGCHSRALAPIAKMVADGRFGPEDRADADQAIHALREVQAQARELEEVIYTKVIVKPEVRA